MNSEGDRGLEPPQAARPAIGPDWRVTASHQPALCFAATAAGLLAAGCAVHGVGQPTLQTVRVETPAQPGARCELSNDVGQWVVPSTPGVVEVRTSLQALRVACHAAGGSSGSMGARASAGKTGGGGALAGGVIGGAAVAGAVGTASFAIFPVLAVVAVATGAAVGATAGHTAEARQQTLRYPDTITVTLATPLAAGAAPAARLGMTVRGLTQAEAGARGLARRGALVTALVDGGVARKVGVLVGDVVLAAAGVEVGDAADLEERVRHWAAGALLQLTVWRDGRTMELVVAPAAAPP
jgi:PDZ domain